MLEWDYILAMKMSRSIFVVTAITPDKLTGSPRVAPKVVRFDSGVWSNIHKEDSMPDKRTPEEVSQLESDAAAYEDIAQFHYQNDEPVLSSINQIAADATQRKIEGEK
jgi:hypothetical protein